MRTKEYCDKLARRNARIVAIWRWRYVILAILCVVVAASILLAVAGSVTYSKIGSTVYGDDIQPLAKAIFRKAAFRYRTLNGEWQSEAPRDVGSYEAQAISHGIAGRERYGKILPFDISPAQLTVKVTDSEVDFGALPESVSASELKYGDKLVVGDFDVLYDDNTANITPIAGQLRVTDEYGRDVTANYNVTVLSKTVICNPIAANIVTASDSWIYDGQPHSADRVKVTGLLEGHIPTDIVTTSVTDASSVSNEVSCRILDEDGNDVSVHYVLTYRLGTLTVDKRPVEITTESADLVYDGTSQSHSEATCKGLAEGHELTGSDWAALDTVGETDNSARFSVTDGKGADVTDNYDISTVFGELKIVKRQMTIVTGNASAVYDGKPHGNTAEPDVSQLNLADGHRFVHGNWAELTDVGEASNRWDYGVFDGEGNDVAANYAIAEKFGTVSVKVRPAVIKTNGERVVYDGKAHTNETAPVMDNLAENDRLKIIDDARPRQTDVGSAVNSVKYTVVNGKGADVKSNYSIEEQWGVIVVDKRPVTVTSAGDSWIYDGQSHSHPDGYTVSKPLDGHTVILDNWTTITDAGSADNKPQSVKVTDGSGADVTANYAFEYKCGKLNVSRRVFDVQTGDAVFVYDGKAHSEKHYDILPSGGAEEGLLVGHRITDVHPKQVTSVTDGADAIGYTDNEQSYTIADESGRDVSDNYAPRGTWGRIRVKEPIRVRVFAKSKFYDGTPLYYQPDDWTVESVPVGVEKAWVNVELAGSLTEVGSLSVAETRIGSKVTVNDGTRDLLADDVDPNRVDFVGSPLTVKARPLTVTSISISQTRGSDPLLGNVDGGAWITVGSLLAEHSIVFNITGVLDPADTVANNTFSVYIKDISGRDVSKYYSITYIFGTLSWL